MAERLPVGRRASVSVPATSANLGPGYDALGLALGLRDDVGAEIADGGVVVEIDGEGADTVARDASNLVARAMRVGFEAIGIEAPGLRLTCRNRIPHGRGLGSSAAAIVAGLQLAAALADDVSSDLDMLGLAAETEGHPDNVAACLLGGLTIAYVVDGRPHGVRLDVDQSIAPALFVPPAAVSTETARGLLPSTVSHRDAASNSARSALLIAALTARPDLLLDATEDRLHQAYRQPAMPQSANLVSRLRAAGHAAVVSGAGPTVLVLSTRSSGFDAAAWTPPGWAAMSLDVDFRGALTDH
jgi:homoserine kinase